MRFTHPEFLWALSLLIIPIIIHLYSFRKYKTIYFSSLQFIQHVEQQNKSIQKLKDIIVLFLRILTIACIVFAFSQPFFPTSTNKSTNQLPILAIHIDNSFSMTMKGVEGELISEAKEVARQLLEKSPLNSKVLLSTNQLDGIESHLCTKVEAIERIDKIKPSPLSRSFDEVIQWQKNTLKNASLQSNDLTSQFIYISDFQKNTQQFNKLSADKLNSYIPIQLVSQSKSNLSVDSIWFGSPLHKVGSTNELFIKVHNHGNENVQNIALSLYTDEIKRDLFVDIQKNSSTITSLSFTPNKEGVQKGKVSISDKQFYSDDDYFFQYTVSKKSAVLIINGPDFNPTVASVYQLDQFYDVQELDQSSFTLGALESKNLVILNGCNEISSGMTTNLFDFTNTGGTVALFPGKKINAISLNSFLSKINMPLIGKEVSQHIRINKINYKDPFFKGVFDKEKENLSLPGITKYFNTIVNNQTNAIAIIHLQNGKGLLYRNQGSQKAFLFSSVLSNEYGSFMSDILYTTLLLRLGELSLNNPPLSITIGDAALYPIQQPLSSEKPLYLKGNKIEFIPEKRTIGSMTYIDLNGQIATSNLTAGNFQLLSDSKQIGSIAVNYNRKESVIDTWSMDQIKQTLISKGISNVNDIIVNKGVQSVNLKIEKPFPYWKIFISFALVFFLTELLVLKWWKNKLKNK